MLKSSFNLFRQAYSYKLVEMRRSIILVILGELLAVGLLYLLNGTYGQLYQGIQEYNVPVIWGSIAKFAAMAMVLVGVNGYLGYFANRLAFNIREGLTCVAILRTGMYDAPENVNQRIQEDIRKFGESSVEFYTAVMKAGLKLPVFLGVIMTLTHWYIGLIIFLLVAAGTVATKLVARRLVKLQSIQESNEAVFRGDLAFSSFGAIIRQFNVINNEFKKLSFVQSGLTQMFVLMPFIILMPMYIAKTIPMGAFFQSVNALGKIVDSLSVLIDSRQVIVQIETCLIRLEFLRD
jgi:ABC-type uncharacterized transport system fused permease/ATPase subunit